MQAETGIEEERRIPVGADLWFAGTPLNAVWVRNGNLDCATLARLRQL